MLRGGIGTVVCDDHDGRSRGPARPIGAPAAVAVRPSKVIQRGHGGAGRICNRFAQPPDPDRPRSPTRTTPRPPIPITAPIRAQEPPFPARKAQFLRVTL